MSKKFCPVTKEECSKKCEWYIHATQPNRASRCAIVGMAHDILSLKVLVSKLATKDDLLGFEERARARHSLSEDSVPENT